VQEARETIGLRSCYGVGSVGSALQARPERREVREVVASAWWVLGASRPGGWQRARNL